MDWKLVASLAALGMSIFSLVRGEMRGHRLRCEKFSEDQWSALRKEIESRRDDFEKELANFSSLAFKGKQENERIELAREAYKALISCHGLLSRSASRCASNDCVHEPNEWASIALRPITAGDTVLDQSGNLFNDLVVQGDERLPQSLGTITALFDEMLKGIDWLIRLENAHHDPQKHAPFGWLPFT